MIKFCTLTFLFISVSYIGIGMSINLKKKETFFNDLLNMCELIYNNIKFNKTKIKIIIENNIDNYNGELKYFLKNFLNNKEYKSLLLTDYENKKVNEFLNSIGKFDTFGELNNIQNYKVIFNNFYETSKNNCKRYGALYSKLSVLIAMVLIITFI